MDKYVRMCVRVLYIKDGSYNVMEPPFDVETKN